MIFRAMLIAGLMTAAAPGLAQTPQPVRIGKAEAAGPVFKDKQVIVENRNGHVSRDRIILNSSDAKFNSGMYESGPSHFVTKGPYGVDEFMLFTGGSVTLTSKDGTVTKLEAGDAVTVPAEWEGTWDSPGYTKYYVIYDRAAKAK